MKQMQIHINFKQQ